MKYFSWLLVMVGLALMGLTTGCGAKHEPEVDKLKAPFAQASAEVKSATAAATTAIKAKKYEDAVNELAKLEGQELSAEQKQAVADVLVDLQTSLIDQGGSSEVLEKVQTLMMSFM
jgi:thioredoxin-like negative regulator of GroEL